MNDSDEVVGGSIKKKRMKKKIRKNRTPYNDIVM